ncbi:hypothetical protein MNV49_005848 [Pseudohyphozyma bogoriensis]|nr:hypothetical protein MNV49_005848 [Pseudohyphozyma bogoriensis]
MAAPPSTSELLLRVLEALGRANTFLLVSCPSSGALEAAMPAKQRKLLYKTICDVAVPSRAKPRPAKSPLRQRQVHAAREGPQISVEEMDVSLLDQLPQELKVLIAERVGEPLLPESPIDAYNLRDLRSLALVNRSFALATFPILWKKVDFTSIPSPSLPFFVSAILPRHSHFIKSIIINRVMRDGWGNGNFVTTSLLRDATFAFILLRLPNVQAVSLDAVDEPIHPRNLDGSDSDEVIDDDDDEYSEWDKYPWLFRNSLVTEVLWARAETIRDLTLEGYSMAAGTWDEDFLAEYVGKFRNLRRLNISNVDLTYGRALLAMGAPRTRKEKENEVNEERRGIVETIAGMERLEDLIIDGAIWVDDEFAKADWKSSLRQLGLGDCAKLSLTSLISTIRPHAATLERLDLDLVPMRVTPSEETQFLGKPFPFPLPNLHDLIISTQVAIFPSFLALFSNCALEKVYIGSTLDIGYNDWVAFIESHVRTLKRVVVQQNVDMPKFSVESLGMFVRARGVDFVDEVRWEEESRGWDGDGDSGSETPTESGDEEEEEQEEEKEESIVEVDSERDAVDAKEEEVERGAAEVVEGARSSAGDRESWTEEIEHGYQAESSEEEVDPAEVAIMERKRLREVALKER